MYDTRVKIINEFFEKFVFVTENSSDQSWVDGAKLIVKGVLQKIDYATIQEILDYLTISGDKKDINSYEKIRELFRDKSNEELNFILNLQSEKTEMGYLEAMTDCIEKYKQNRKLINEEMVDYFAKIGFYNKDAYFTSKKQM